MQITLPVILFTDIPPYEPSLQAILLSSGPILGLWNGQCLQLQLSYFHPALHNAVHYNYI